QDTLPTGLMIYNVWVRPTAAAPADGATPEPPLPGTISGVYMTIENDSDADYRLVGVSDEIAEMTMLHEMTMDAKGVMRMHMISSLDIPAGTTVALDSNGYHAMLMNVSADIYPGEAVPLLLTFADPDGKTFEVQVAAIATDIPPANDPLVVANAAAVKAEDGTLTVSLILDNRGEGAEMLTGAISPSVTVNVELTEIPAHAQVALTDIAGLAGALKDDAFPLTLIFDSGKQITLAVPVQAASIGSDS
ncbi:MAG: copper chaperone PCu(A)C, partial [Chloroflexota bacterium]